MIIEPRKHKALCFVLQNILSNLSVDWNIILFHGLKNIEYVNNILSNNIDPKQKNRISLENLNIENITRYEYSTLLKSIDFYDKIPTEIFLVFQTDSMIFERNKHLINDFLEYEYVGAPWQKTIGWAASLNFVGNGGFSLRRKSKMIEIINNNPSGVTNPKYLEDIFFVNNKSLNKPNYYKAMSFAFESVFCENAFACHAPWKFIPKDILYTHYPELKQLRDLQGVDS